jgi:hypothetical protein
MRRVGVCTTGGDSRARSAGANTTTTRTTTLGPIGDLPSRRLLQRLVSNTLGVPLIVSWSPATTIENDVPVCR